MTAAGIREAMKAALKKIPDTRVYDAVPDGAYEFPCIVVNRLGVEAERTFSQTSEDLSYELAVLVRESGGIDQAQRQLDEYMEASGQKSVKAALNGVAWGGHASDHRFVRWNEPGRITDDQQAYLGARAEVIVMVD